MRTTDLKLIGAILCFLGFATCSLGAVMLPSESQEGRHYGREDDEEAADRAGSILVFLSMGLFAGGGVLMLQKKKKSPGYHYPDWNR